MNAESYNRLAVELSASQVRRLLKGRGFGVRRIESAGKGRAVVVHTATGQHQRELTSFLTAAASASHPPQHDDSIRKLRNIGEVSAGWLEDVGITTCGKLQQLGPATAFRMVKQKYPRASLNLLWSLAAGMMDQDWRDLSTKDRKKLLAELDED